MAKCGWCIAPEGVKRQHDKCKGTYGTGAKTWKCDCAESGHKVLTRKPRVAKVEPQPEVTAPKRRGRPKGSKNKKRV